MENREMPILHKSQVFGWEMPWMRAELFFVCRYLPANKKSFLCDLCASVVKVNNLMLCLIIILDAMIREHLLCCENKAFSTEEYTFV